MKQLGLAVVAGLAGVLLSACGGSSGATEPTHSLIAATHAPAKVPTVHATTSGADVAGWVAALRSTKARPEVPNEPTWAAEVVVVVQTATAAQACDPTLTQTCDAFAASVGPYAADLALGLEQQPEPPAALIDLVSRTHTAAKSAEIAPTLSTAVALADVLHEWDAY